MERKAMVAGLLAIVFLATVSAFAGDDAQVKGMITTRNGDTLTVKSSDGNTTTVVLTDDTRTKDNVGLFGLDRKDYSSAVLMPGLKVDVKGSPGDGGRVVAKTITVDGDDLEASQMIESGLHPTAEQVAANVQTLQEHQQKLAGHEQDIATNKQDIATHQQNIAANKAQIEQNIKDIEENSNRFAQLADYDIKGQATVKFGVGSSTLDKKDKEDLKNLAQTATAMSGGYIVEVMGYADSTGGAAMNTKLSGKRAQSVIEYLVQQCGVRPRFIVAPGAMGEYGPAAPNETKAGRAENRRVEVKVLVNKGIAGTSS
jgi:outer membrane protein OmpA-like peptidoglycan-associated protein